MKKILYIVLDGLGDRPCPELEGKTPLQAASTPHIDSLAKAGKTGLMYTVGKGIAPESDIAVISILGYDAKRYYTGRGPLESFAAGLEVNNGDLAYRVNFATRGKGREIIDRRVGRNLTSEEAKELAKEINSKVKLTDATFEFKSTIGHRGVLVIRNKAGKLSAEVTNTDPAYTKEGPFGVAKEKFENIIEICKPTEEGKKLEEAKKAAALTNEFVEKSTQILNGSEINKKRIKEGKLPGNLILTRDAGDRLPKFPPMSKQFGVKFGCFVEMPVEKGIALLTGMEIVEVGLPTGDPEKDYILRANKALEAIKTYDGLYIHIKGPDEPAHDGKAVKKKESIEAIDKFFLGKLLPKINLNEYLIIVTADHSTPCVLKAHSDDPVPLLIAGGGLSPDNVQVFTEEACKKGEIGEISGPELMPLIIKHAK